MANNFGTSRDEYVFITPPLGYFGVVDGQEYKNVPYFPRGNPMPRRLAKNDSTAKVITWEDPVYLCEWVSEIAYWYQQQPINIAEDGDRRILLERLIDGVVYENYQISSFNIAEGLKCSSQTTYSIAYRLYGAYDLYSWIALVDYGISVDWGLFIYKIEEYDPISQVVTISSTTQNSEWLMLFASGYVDEEFCKSSTSESDRWRQIKNKYCDIFFAQSKGKVFIDNCMDENHQVLSTENNIIPFNHNIILSLYSILQYLAGNIVFVHGAGITIESQTETSFDATVSKICTNDYYVRGIIYSVIDKKIEGNTHDEQHKPEYSYSVITLQEPIEAIYEEEKTGMEGDTIIKTTKIYSGDVNTIASVKKDYTKHSDWSCKTTEMSKPTADLVWNSNEDEWEWAEYHNNGFYIFPTGNGQGISGTVHQFSKFTFTLKRDFAQIRYHTANGKANSENENKMYLVPQDFFFKVQINVVRWEKITNTITEEDTDQYITSGIYNLLIPMKFNGNYIKCNPNPIPDSNGRLLTVWEVTENGVKEIIAQGLNKIKNGAYDEWDSVAKSIPNSMSENKAPQIDEIIEPTTGTEYSIGRNASSYNIDVKINISDIAAAMKWDPKPSVGLPTIEDSFFNPLI